jgi:diaminopimelate epimerase
MKGVIEPELTPDGRVTVDMGAPVFDPVQLPFDTQGLTPKTDGDWQSWPLTLDDSGTTAWIAPVSMGNPHAVQRVADVDTAPVEAQGPLVQQHPRFARHVNAGFMHIVNRSQIRLRVYERGVGETLACGSGACAAVVAGIRWGLLDACVDVYTRGGVLTIAWAGGNAPVMMTGPAVAVFSGEIDLPATL